MPDNEHTHHEINYIEFTATDIEGAKQFYGSAFGWMFNDYGPEYVGIRKQTGDGEAGGICLGSEVKPGGPLVVLYSDDLERSVESVVKAGGEITKDIVSFPGGRRFQFTDPSGNELAVWSDKLPNEGTE